MSKILLFVFLSLSLFALETTHFKEQRYLYALNQTLNREGTITFSRESLTIRYLKSGESLIYQGEKLLLRRGGREKVIDLNQDVARMLFFVLLLAIFHDDRRQLEQFFEISSRGSQQILYPKALVSRQIEKVIYKKSHRLDYLHIYLKNHDRISIEQVDEVR